MYEKKNFLFCLRKVHVNKFHVFGGRVNDFIGGCGRRDIFWFDLRQMEAHASLAGSQLQFLFHDFARRVLGNLQVVHARHHRGQILIGILISVHLLSDDCQGRRESLEAAGGQARRSRHKLQEESLVLARVLTENVVEVLNGERVLGEAVISATAVGEHSRVPFLVV